MRSISALPNQYNHVHQHQHQPQQTAPMVLVKTPDGGMGWVPQQAMQQAMGQMPMQPQAGAMSPTFKTLLWAGGLGLVGWWAYKKYGKGERSEDRREERQDYARSRRRRRSRSRIMSEFKNFLDNSGGAREDNDHGSACECAECVGECLECVGEDDRDVQVEGGVNY